MMNVLILDDDRVLNGVFNRVISKDNSVTSVYSYDEGVQALNIDKYDLVITDVKLPAGSGLDFLKVVKSIQPNCYVFVMTGYADVEDAVEAIKNGASDYLIKPIDHVQLLNKINIIKENINFRSIASLEKNDLFLQSESMDGIVKMVAKVAKTDSCILLTGETGTGKTLIAKYIHSMSLRSSKPFLAINCANFQENIFESELFGYKKGAFTGANQNKAGLVSFAEGGTLFLDEIGEIPLNFQSKLLKFLDEKNYLQLGSAMPVKADVRIIAATNKNLPYLVENKEFRSDLYYRLNVINIELPPLRDRRKDIAPLAEYMVAKYGSLNTKVKKISKEALTLLKNYDFKGNIRELANVIERAMILEESAEITLSSINIGSDCDGKDDLASNEKKHIIKILKRCNNDKTKAAEILNIDRSTLYRKIKDYDIQ